MEEGSYFVICVHCRLLRDHLLTFQDLLARYKQYKRKLEKRLAKLEKAPAAAKQTKTDSNENNKQLPSSQTKLLENGADGPISTEAEATTTTKDPMKTLLGDQAGGDTFSTDIFCVFPYSLQLSTFVLIF